MPIDGAAIVHTVDIGTADTAGVNGDVDIMVFEFFQRELFLVETLPPGLYVSLQFQW